MIRYEIGYEVWDINRYVEYCLQLDIISDVVGAKKQFKELSKGFNFIIAVNTNTKGYVFFSVPFFNDKVIGND